MQEPIIYLKEIIWEITDECYNGCTYCGSKSILNKIKPSKEKILEIATNIAQYLDYLVDTQKPRPSIDISGGDPMELGWDLHEEILEILERHELKILLNPKSVYRQFLKDEHNAANWRLILDNYDWVGISVNTIEELRLITDKELGYDFSKTTIITNFNKPNIWDYEKFEALAIEKNLVWQIQYTMYPNDDNDYAIYNCEDAKKLLFDKINKSMDKGVKVIVSDNMNIGQCFAGKHGCGILANGYVVPCLSMRSWTDRDVSIANLYDHSLKKIWEQAFGIFRCSQFECCKDLCASPFERTSTRPDVTITTTAKPMDEPVYIPANPSGQPPFNPNGIVMVYAVQTNHSFVYGLGTLNAFSTNNPFGSVGARENENPLTTARPFTIEGSTFKPEEPQ